MRSRSTKAAVVLSVALAGSGCALLPKKALPPGEALTKQERTDAIRRASVWSPTDIARVDFRKGPDVEGDFAPNQWVNCEYKKKKMTGQSPKFTCELSPGQDIKVKYGPRNAEVYAEVLTTRLLWGLGFAADAVYPVRVRCRGCSTDPKHLPEKVAGTQEFDPAAIERKTPGRAMETTEDSGWKWSELDEIGPESPKDARTHRDALKLLAAFVQHSDSKAANQRLLCPKGEEIGKTGCRAPVLMIQDVGITFGESTLLNKNKNAASYHDWAGEPVWKDAAACVANLDGSFTGRFKNPKVSEAGRAFLAGLLMQVSDAQLRDLFEAARIRRRSADPSTDPSKEPAPATVDEWVRLFKAKRAQLANNRCST